MTPQPISIKLDRERRIAFTNAARFRLGIAPNPVNFEDLRNTRKAYAALITWIWACLVPEDAKDFASPEAVSEFVGLDNQGEVLSALLKAIESAAVPEKNGHGSTPKPSPSSS